VVWEDGGREVNSRERTAAMEAARQTGWRARATGSRVISGFFPPKPVGWLGDEGHDELTEDPGSHPPDVAAALEGRESDRALGDAEDVLDVAAGEGHIPQRLQGGAWRRLREEIRDLAGVGVLDDDQPIGAIGRNTAPREVNLGGVDEPALGRQCLRDQFNKYATLSLT